MNDYRIFLSGKYLFSGQEGLSPVLWAERNRGESEEERRPVGIAGGRFAGS
jgi:hypothetical protein